MTEQKNFNFTASNGISLQADLYLASDKRRNTTIVYLHGGGLLYGVRDDLPQVYIKMLLAAGYDLLTVDYPLAPESNLAVILDTALEELQFYLHNNCSTLGLANEKYILFGRSAGAYLALMLCNRLIMAGWHRPTALISLYGYTGFTEPQFAQPSKHYNKLAKISNMQAEKIISATPIVYGALSERFALYIKARQDGNWPEYLGVDTKLPPYSLDAVQLQNLPPLIMAAATLDPDVPYKLSKNLAKAIPSSKLITVYEQEHDFDRDTAKPLGKNVYAEIIDWLNAII